jgi:hypothetical protein
MEMNPKMEGRNLISIFVPDKLKVKEALRKQEVEKKKAEQEAAARLQAEEEAQKGKGMTPSTETTVTN